MRLLIFGLMMKIYKNDQKKDLFSRAEKRLRGKVLLFFSIVTLIFGFFGEFFAYSLPNNSLTAITIIWEAKNTRDCRAFLSGT